MTAAKLAKALNLSRTTVSLVLNGRAERYGLARETVEKVLKGAKRHNYHPDPVARQLAGKSSNVVGILVSSACVVDPRLIERMEILAAERQVRFIVGHAIGDAEKVKEYLHDFRARRLDAMVSFHHNHPVFHGAVLDELRQMDRVLYYEKPAARIPNPWYVEIDYHAMGRAAAGRFVASGRRRVGLIGLAETIYPVLRRRRLGFQKTLREAGLPHGRELVWRVDERRSLRWNEPPTPAEAEAVVEELVVRQRCDAIFAVNDLYAARLVAALRSKGITVPGDVALIGADNMDISTLIDPRITTMDVQIDDLARATVGLLFEMIGREPGPATGESAHAPSPSVAAPRGITVTPRLVVRESA
jgi:LacI family transcriptional regulator